MGHPYSEYVKAYGKVKSKATLTPRDFVEPNDDGFSDFPERVLVAISLASMDAANGNAMRTKAELIAEVDRLTGPG